MTRIKKTYGNFHQTGRNPQLWYVHTYPKTHSCEDNAKFNSAFSVTTLSYTTRFRRRRGVIENFEYLGVLKKIFEDRSFAVFCIKMQKKGLKTDYENLVHVYL